MILILWIFILSSAVITTTVSADKTENLFRKLHKFEMVIPFLVDVQGNFLSFDVKNEDLPRRNKRSTQEFSQTIFYNLTAFGKDYHFELKPNYKLVSDKYSAEVWNDFRITNEGFKNCHYVGRSRQPFVSKAAISNCFGLHGMFQTENEEIFVEPVWNHTSSISGHPHVVYRRSDIKHAHIECGVNDIQTHFKTSTARHSDSIVSHKSKPQYIPDVTRGRRSIISAEKNVETLVVADREMVQYHGKHVIESYVLSIMNVVAQLFHDASIGNAINIVVSRLVILEKDQQNLTLNYHADKSLDSFCKWQNALNLTTEEMGAVPHDNAVLITGYDICTYKNRPCGTLGLAPVSGMCNGDRSCSINEDIGLATAFTVAHELGHNFGMQHDGSGNVCGTEGSDELAGIMAAQLTKDTRPFNWSSCSRQYITEFLDSERGQCLNNKPSQQLLVKPEFRRFPPRQINSDEQCVLQFGETSRLCKPEHVCNELWCYNEEKECTTNSIPAAEGTLCPLDNNGQGWCYRGECRHPNWRPDPQDGQWGKWSNWDTCTRTCGVGVESSYRRCDDPEPRHGGKYCVGERKRYRSCNIQSCPDNDVDFREIQCADFNTKLFRGKYYNWKPFSGAHGNPCALNCIADGFSFYTERASKVIDGTRCFSDKMDLCINGKCLPVGCDGVLGSNATEDRCRKCNGDGTSCQTITGQFTKQLPKGAYHEVLKIPKGSVHIEIKETRDSINYLALKRITDEYYINGEWTIDWPRTFSVAGTVFTYEREDNKPEMFKALGPTSEDLVIMILLQEDNLGVDYVYNVPVNWSTYTHDATLYTWQHSAWSECSLSCGRGSRTSTALCVRKFDRSAVNNKLCYPQPKPTDHSRVCNDHPCPPTWTARKWSQCTETCGSNRHKNREVVCTQRITQDEQVILPDNECPNRKPVTLRKCRNVKCPAIWFPDQWSECSAECGTGKTRRRVFCMTSDGQTYLQDNHCNRENKPLTLETCINKPCPPPAWVTEEWGQCSVTCGKGVQTRRVVCRNYLGVRVGLCPLKLKPTIYRQCHRYCDDQHSGDDCIDQDKAQFCPLVEKFRVCNRDYFFRMCCRTCVNSGQRVRGRG